MKMMQMMACTMGCVALLCGCGDNNAASGPEEPARKVTIDVGTVQIDMDKVRAAIHTWQKDRWNADAIVSARAANGRLSASDLKVDANYDDMQPMFDVLVSSYVVYVNALDAFADAKTPSEAVGGLLKVVSFEDSVKMAKDLSKAVDSAKAIKNKAGWRDVAPIARDMVTITSLAASMTNAAGILKGIFDEATAKK